MSEEIDYKKNLSVCMENLRKLKAERVMNLLKKENKQRKVHSTKKERNKGLHNLSKRWGFIFNDLPYNYLDLIEIILSRDPQEQKKLKLYNRSVINEVKKSVQDVLNQEIMRLKSAKSAADEGATWARNRKVQSARRNKAENFKMAMDAYKKFIETQQYLGVSGIQEMSVQEAIKRGIGLKLPDGPASSLTTISDDINATRDRMTSRAPMNSSTFRRRAWSSQTIGKGKKKKKKTKKNLSSKGRTRGRMRGRMRGRSRGRSRGRKGRSRGRMRGRKR